MTFASFHLSSTERQQHSTRLEKYTFTCGANLSDLELPGCLLGVLNCNAITKLKSSTTPIQFLDLLHVAIQISFTYILVLSPMCVAKGAKRVSNVLHALYFHLNHPVHIRCLRASVLIVAV